MASVEKSAPKWTFMRALSLDDDNESHQEIYNAMKRETVAVYDELLKGRRQNLQPRFINIPEPWSYSHFTDFALRQATERICARASSRTRAVYARGQGRASGENWVVQWMLYHICRYRDSRNLRCRSAKFHEDDDTNLMARGGGGRGRGSADGSRSGHSAASSSKTSSSSSSSTAGGRLGEYYDAARNSYK